MLLSDLVKIVPESEQVGSGDPEIGAIVYDSRKVVPGALFVCISGEKFDGHAFAAGAVENGAVAIIGEDAEALRPLASSVPVVIVPDTRPVLPVIATEFSGHPTRKLKLVGVTGTKGKTTTTYLVESILQAAGHDTGVIGTLGARIRGEHIPEDRTTPESVELQSLFARMVSEGVTAAAMEVSSHALVKGRTDGCEYDVGIFTNLTHDHLDFHHTFDEYLEAKLILFTEYPGRTEKPFTAVINIDDPRGGQVKDAAKGRILTFGVHNPADIRAKNIEAYAHKVMFDVETPKGDFSVCINLGGMFNVYNALAGIGAGLALGIEPEVIVRGLANLSAVPGRFESVDCGQGFGVLVDYAHTPDSLENVLRSARELTKERLIVVFGCGGDRDRAKRPVMGRIGTELADVCIVTSDNPRTEDPDAIIKEILEGAGPSAEAIPDRRAAIERALEVARDGDVVVIAGKGHEPYQIFADRTIHFDDREEVRNILCAGKEHG